MTDSRALPSNSANRLSLWVRLGMAVLVVLAMTIFAVLTWTRSQQSAKDEEAAIANARGIAFLEQYETLQANGKTGFENAADQFASAMRLSPDWSPAKINYGMSLFFTGKEEKLDAAIQVFQELLQQDPDNPYALYCLGIIHYYRSNPTAANPYFARVTELDPMDAYAWYFRGLSVLEREESADARSYFQKAVDLDPYLTSARFSLAGHTLTDDPGQREKLQRENQALRTAFWERVADTKPSKMGKYGTPIGSSPAPPIPKPNMPGFLLDDATQIKLQPGTVWATNLEGIKRNVQDRFGGTLVRLDYDNDGKPDLLLLSAVSRSGVIGDLLLHNEGNGVFSDVTSAMGLGKTASLGASVADFDNSGYCDLLLTTEDGVRLFRNQNGARFEDVTALASLSDLRGVFLTASWIDLDQDGDLDLVLGRSEPASDGLLVFINRGEAPPTPRNQPPAPLQVQFQRLEHPAFAVKGSISGLVATDIDNDGDVDLIVLINQQPPLIILNDRLLRFHVGPKVTDEIGEWTGGMVMDRNHDEQSDYLLLRATDPPILITSTYDGTVSNLLNRFVVTPLNTPPLRQAQTADLEHNSRQDLVGLSNTLRPVVMVDSGASLKPYSIDALQSTGDIKAIASCDYNGDCHNDLILWSVTNGLQFYRNQGNTNRSIQFQLLGRRDPESARTNNDAVGAKVMVMTGSLRSFFENTTLSAGLGQSRIPFNVGVGASSVAHALRIRWPDVVPQAEVDLAAECKVHRIAETERRSSSCPVLFSWDGSQFCYITDILGAGSVGELSADGSTRPPRSEESVAIESHRLAVQDGRYQLKLAEPMDEILYLDFVQLDVVDHPSDMVVLPDERFATAEPSPTQKLLSFQKRFSPRGAINHRGQDVLPRLLHRDQRTVDDFQRRLWHGFAEDHAIELDFGDQLAKLPADAELHLILAGWTDYAYPDTIFAAQQAGIAMRPPTLERLSNDGQWKSLGEIGFPAGLPRVMTSPVKGLAGTTSCRLRIRTNMHIYWDQVQLGVAESVPPTVHSLPVSHAVLSNRGFAREVLRNRKPPAEYNDNERERVTYTRWKGKITRLGEVTELLTLPDDQFVICGAGEEVLLEFDASTLPPLAVNASRSFVLRSQGFCKDAAPFTATFGEVGPLPFRSMTSYPQGARDPARIPPGQDAYNRLWNTRDPGAITSRK